KIEIARRKLVERTLRDTEERFCQLVEYGDDVFWLAEPDLRRILYVSPSYERIWGRPLRRLYTHPQDWLDAIHEDDRQRVREAFANYVTGCVRQLRSRVGRRADLLEMMEEAAAEALRGGEIIRHLWDFVHKRTPEREPADVNQLVRDVTRLIGVEADEKGIAIH